jgi:hypothetical protein
MVNVAGQGYFGNTGFSSGGSLAAVMGVSTTTTIDHVNTGTAGFSTIAYLGYNDAKTALGDGAVECSYDGVPFSTNNIINGTYSFWGNEYIYKANNVTSGGTPEAYAVYSSLASIGKGLDTIFDGVSAIPLDAMHSSRPGPTGDPAHY